MQGTSGTFSFGGTPLLLMPEEAGWVSKELIGISGNGRPTYPTVREFEMTWSMMDMDSFAQLQGFYNTIQSSGTWVVDLPKYATAPYQFYSYSGCTLKEPEIGKFFEYYAQNVQLLILMVK